MRNRVLARFLDQQPVDEAGRRVVIPAWLVGADSLDQALTVDARGLASTRDGKSRIQRRIA